MVAFDTAFAALTVSLSSRGCKNSIKIDSSEGRRSDRNLEKREPKVAHVSESVGEKNEGEEISPDSSESFETSKSLGRSMKRLPRNAFLF